MVAGAQIPIYETRSDGKDNLLGSLIMASSFVIPEVGKFEIMQKGFQMLFLIKTRIKIVKILNYIILKTYFSKSPTTLT